jgi:2-keto-4-pentenoate hydratase
MTIIKTLRFFCLAVCAAAATLAQARCPDYKDIVNYVAAYLNREPAKALPGVATLGDAQCAQGALAAELARHQGTLAGFRAGFTNKAMQQTYKIEGPLRAFLFKKMFLDDGASVDANYGARPWFEANFIAVVKDGALQEAKTPLEALEHISHFLPYIELTDFALAADEPLTKVSMIATNVGTRLGVIGEPIAVEATEAFLEKLAKMQVIVTDQDGRELGRGDGRDMLEHPMNSVLWLARSLSYDGLRIIEGDKLSLGAFVPAAAPQAGTKIKVQYLGLPGDPSVSVSFR